MEPDRTLSSSGASPATPVTARNVAEGFLRSCERFPDRPALEVEGKRISYGELRGRAASIAATLARHTPAGGSPLAAVFAYRSETAFAGVLGALLAGYGYVPLNRTFPAERTRTMLQLSQCHAVVADERSAGQLDAVLSGFEHPLLVLLPDHSDAAPWKSKWPRHCFRTAQELEPAAHSVVEVSPDAIAYLLFTSGSTGVPKGVMVAHRNVAHFVDVMTARYRITEQDRFSQTFDMSFDLSAFDMFVAWERGACVCCPSQKVLLNPGKFIRENRLTVWFSVPSVAVFMKRLGSLKAGQFPTLRWSLFCGEALPADLACAWAEAAPQSIVENLYGPTELTIACMLYRWHADSERECEMGLVPIGDPYPQMEAIVVDENLREVAPGSTGELLMAGPQLSLGYWNDAEITRAAFVVPPGRNRTFYRTGDRVRRPSGAAPMTYLGRMDEQVKILGHRVELGEIESLLRQEAGAQQAVAVAWPARSSGADGIVAFLTEARVPSEDVLARLQQKLPGYSVPKEIRVIAEFPLNSSGKIDRNALRKLLEEKG